MFNNIFYADMHGYFMYKQNNMFFRSSKLTTAAPQLQILCHNSDVTRTLWCLESQVNRMFFQQFVRTICRDNIIKDQKNKPIFLGESNSEQWISLINVKQFGKRFPVITPTLSLPCTASQVLIKYMGYMIATLYKALSTTIRHMLYEF